MVNVSANELPGGIAPEFTSAVPSYVFVPVPAWNGGPDGKDPPTAGNVTVWGTLLERFLNVIVVPTATVTL